MYSKVPKKGSFLLKAENIHSDAAQILNLSNKHIENSRIGKELIRQRDQQIGANVSVFYKQDGGLVITCL